MFDRLLLVYLTGGWRCGSAMVFFYRRRRVVGVGGGRGADSWGTGRLPEEVLSKYVQVEIHKD